MALPDPPGRRAAQHRPENGRRLGSASPARPRRWALAAARPGEGRSDPLHRGPVLQGARCALTGAPGGQQRDPGAPTEAPRGPRPTQRTAASASTSQNPRKDNPLGGSAAEEHSRHQNKAWARRRVPGSLTQIPDSSQILRIGESQVQLQFS